MCRLWASAHVVHILYVVDGFFFPFSFSVISAVVTVGKVLHLDKTWAVDKVRAVGYNFNEESHPSVFELFDHVFNKR